MVLCENCLYNMGANVPEGHFCSLGGLVVFNLGCSNGVNKGKTNRDTVNGMTNEEFANWFWWMLGYTKGYTDSHEALIQWLDKVPEGVKR